jgi:predicted transposase/invertase (TIGR01784 family)
MDKWLYAIKNLGKLDDKPAALTEAIFKRFFEVAEIAAFSKTERYDYEENLKNYTDWFNVLNTAKKEGLAEGEAIGVEKGRAEGEAIAMQKMAKRLKSQGVSADVIAEASGLTLGEIEKL